MGSENAHQLHAGRTGPGLQQSPMRGLISLWSALCKGCRDSTHRPGAHPTEDDADLGAQPLLDLCNHQLPEVRLPLQQAACMHPGRLGLLACLMVCGLCVQANQQTIARRLHGFRSGWEGVRPPP